jgi:hypothetical protein
MDVSSLKVGDLVTISFAGTSKSHWKSRVETVTRVTPKLIETTGSSFIYRRSTGVATRGATVFTGPSGVLMLPSAADLQRHALAEAEVKRKAEEVKAYTSREDVQIAERLGMMCVDDWLKLGLDELRLILAKVNATRHPDKAIVCKHPDMTLSA